MKIQSISIVVPTKRCVNNCPFCVSRMHDSEYENNFDFQTYRKRIKYAVMNGVTTLIITGTGEALQNTKFLNNLITLLKEENYPFPNVELQTTGVFLNKKSTYCDENSGDFIDMYDNLSLLKQLGVNTISLSVSDLFDSENNMKIIGTPEKLKFDLSELINIIKNNGFNVRLSLNLINTFDEHFPADIILKCKMLGADQITFREMYGDNNMISPETKWVENNKASYKTLVRINEYVKSQGKFLYKLPFGADVYSIMGMSIAVDSDCMSQDNNDTMKYVILRENGKLYCRWDDNGSLIF